MQLDKFNARAVSMLVTFDGEEQWNNLYFYKTHHAASMLIEQPEECCVVDYDSRSWPEEDQIKLARQLCVMFSIPMSSVLYYVIDHLADIPDVEVAVISHDKGDHVAILGVAQ